MLAGPHGGARHPLQTTSLDEAFGQAASYEELLLHPVHPTAVRFMIIAKKMQQAVQREDLELGEFRVSRRSSLAARDTERDHNVT